MRRIGSCSFACWAPDPHFLRARSRPSSRTIFCATQMTRDCQMGRAARALYKPASGQFIRHSSSSNFSLSARRAATLFAYRVTRANPTLIILPYSTSHYQKRKKRKLKSPLLFLSMPGIFFTRRQMTAREYRVWRNELIAGAVLEFDGTIETLANCCARGRRAKIS